MPVLPSYRDHSKCTANQLTGFNMRATLAFNGLKEEIVNVKGIVINWLQDENEKLCAKCRKTRKTK